MHARCCLWLRSYLSTRRCRSSFDATRKNVSAVGRQWTVRSTTGVIVSRFQSFFCCWFTSMESATCINPSNGLHRDVQAPSKTSLVMEAYCVPINLLLLVKLLFPLVFRLFLLYCILCHFILFSVAVYYCKRRYTNSFFV